MKKMWIQLKQDLNRADLKAQLAEIGHVEDDPTDSARIIITFHNQSESGMRMAGFRLSQDFIGYFQDFDMIWDKE